MATVTVYVASVAALREEAAYAAAYAAASDARRQKVERLKNADDRIRALAAERLLRQALRAHGVSGEPTFRYGAHGKPYLAELPLYFNLSHAGEYVICAVSDGEVGCDIERVGAPHDAVAKRFTPREYEAVKQGEDFFRLWVLKESFLKATGQGLALPLDAFEITLGQPVTVRQEWDARTYAFWESDVIAGYRIAVCRAGEPFTATLRRMEI